MALYSPLAGLAISKRSQIDSAALVEAQGLESWPLCVSPTYVYGELLGYSQEESAQLTHDGHIGDTYADLLR